MHTAVLLLVLLLAGCSSTSKLDKFDSGCDLVCKDCKEITLKCNTDLDKDHDAGATGTISGPSIGG